MNRLKASMMCSFALVRRGIIVIAVMEIITLAILLSGAWDYLVQLILGIKIEDVRIALGLDTGIIGALFIFGISFYGRHSDFCLSNSVSGKYRLITFGTVLGSVCLLTAALTALVYGIAGKEYSYSFSEFYRFMVTGGIFDKNMAAASFAENLFYYISAVSFGSFIGGLREKKGDGFTLLMLLIGAAVIFVMAYIGQSIAAYICIPFAFMLRGRFTAVIMYFILSAVFLFFTFKLSDSFYFSTTED